jgi:hypothetical protein
VNSLALNLGTIRDSSGNDATVLLPTVGGASSLAGNKAIVIDTVAPTAPSGLVLTPVGGTVVSNTLLATTTNLTASATMTAGQATGGTANLLLGDTVLASDTSIGSSDTTLAFLAGSFNSSSALQSAIAAGGAVTVQLIDAAGNISSSSASVTLIVDYVIPTIAVTASTFISSNRANCRRHCNTERASSKYVHGFRFRQSLKAHVSGLHRSVAQRCTGPHSHRPASRNQVTGSSRSTLSCHLAIRQETGMLQVRLSPWRLILLHQMPL